MKAVIEKTLTLIVDETGPRMFGHWIEVNDDRYFVNPKYGELGVYIELECGALKHLSSIEVTEKEMLAIDGGDKFINWLHAEIVPMLGVVIL